MITAHKYLNLDYSVINVSAYIIDVLTRHGKIFTYSELQKGCIKSLGSQSKSIFPYALDFLFLLGVLVYNEALDSFEIVEKHEIQ